MLAAAAAATVEVCKLRLCAVLLLKDRSLLLLLLVVTAWVTLAEQLQLLLMERPMRCWWAAGWADSAMHGTPWCRVGVACLWAPAADVWERSMRPIGIQGGGVTADLQNLQANAMKPRCTHPSMPIHGIERHMYHGMRRAAEALASFWR